MSGGGGQSMPLHRQKAARKWLAATPAERCTVSRRQADDYRDAALELLAERVMALEEQVQALRARVGRREERRRKAPAAEEKAAGAADGMRDVMAQAEKERCRRMGVPPVARVLQTVARETGVSVEEMRGARRTRHLVQARQVAAWLLARTRPELSLPQIGRLLGGRDHTTIIHAIRTVEGSERLLALARDIARRQRWRLSEAAETAEERMA